MKCKCAILSGFILLIIPLLVEAKDLYRWQDEQGQWHFGDSASSNRQLHVEVVKSSLETANFIKTKIVKLSSKKVIKQSRVSLRKPKTKAILTKVEKQEQCDKLRDDLRFKAFRDKERDYYDRECISKVKW